MPAQFEELAGSPTLSMQNGMFEGQRVFKVRWADTIEFAVDLLGGYRVVNGNYNYNGPAIFPGVPQALCRSIEMVPFHDKIITPASRTINLSTNQHEHALVTAGYSIDEAGGGGSGKTPPSVPAAPAGTTITHHESAGAEWITIPGEALKWYLDGEEVGDSALPGVLVPTGEASITWARVPYSLVPWSAIDKARGMLNNATFLGHAAGTVLFMGITFDYEHQISGPVLVNVVYSFKIRTITGTGASQPICGWNHYYRKEAIDGEHWLEVVADDGKKPYQLTAFGPLFAFGS